MTTVSVHKLFFDTGSKLIDIPAAKQFIWTSWTADSKLEEVGI